MKKISSFSAYGTNFNFFFVPGGRSGPAFGAPKAAKLRQRALKRRGTPTKTRGAAAGYGAAGRSTECRKLLDAEKSTKSELPREHRITKLTSEHRNKGRSFRNTGTKSNFGTQDRRVLSEHRNREQFWEHRNKNKNLADSAPERIFFQSPFFSKSGSKPTEIL